MIYDAHNHLQDERLAPWRGDFNNLGVARAVVNGTSEKDWHTVLALADEHSWIVPSLGLHPWFVSNRSRNWLATLTNLLDTRNCAIGEIGLDRWMENPDVPAQDEAFVAQLNLAAERNLPVAIHCLKAWGTLDQTLRAEKLPACGFLLHSYGGPSEMVQGFADLGAYFSISGYFAHPRKTRQQEVFRAIPLDRLLIETDAPDMSLPEERDSYRLSGGGGKPINHPGNIRAVYAFAAELWNLPGEELEQQVEANFNRLFGAVSVR